MSFLTAIILAAGRGERMGAGINKVLLPLAGRSLLSYALDMWQPWAGRILVAAQTEDWPLMEPILASYGELAALAPGGNSRAASLKRALAALAPATHTTDEFIAIHDAARPLTAYTDIKRTIEAAKSHGAAILAAPVTDTIRYRQGELCGEIIPRESLIAAQTPQIFRRSLLTAAYEQGDEAQLAAITDDAALVQAQGYSCAYVLAERANLKLTTPQDMEVLCALVSATTPIV